MKSITKHTEPAAFHTDPNNGDAAPIPYCDECETCGKKKLSAEWRDDMSAYMCNECNDTATES